MSGQNNTIVRCNPAAFGAMMTAGRPAWFGSYYSAAATSDQGKKTCYTLRSQANPLPEPAQNLSTLPSKPDVVIPARFFHTTLPKSNPVNLPKKPVFGITPPSKGPINVPTTGAGLINDTHYTTATKRSRDEGNEQGSDTNEDRPSKRAKVPDDVVTAVATSPSNSQTNATASGAGVRDETGSANATKRGRDETDEKRSNPKENRPSKRIKVAGDEMAAAAPQIEHEHGDRLEGTSKHVTVTQNEAQENEEPKGTRKSRNLKKAAARLPKKPAHLSWPDGIHPYASQMKALTMASAIDIVTDHLIGKLNSPTPEPVAPVKKPAVDPQLPKKPVLCKPKKVNAPKQVPTPVYGKNNLRKARMRPTPKSKSEDLIDQIYKLLKKKKEKTGDAGQEGNVSKNSTVGKDGEAGENGDVGKEIDAVIGNKEVVKN